MTTTPPQRPSLNLWAGHEMPIDALRDELYRATHAIGDTRPADDPDPDDVARWSLAYMAREGTPNENCGGYEMGGSLHIVLHDANLDDHFITWCRGYADGSGDDLGSWLASLWEQMDVIERVRVYDAIWSPK